MTWPRSRSPAPWIVPARRGSPTAASDRGPVLVADDTGVLADPSAPDAARSAILERMFADASPSPRSMRASPDYRLAMLRVLGRRALATAIERLAAVE